MTTQTDVLVETAAEVEQLVINCLSEFFEEVVLPRYMKTTKDGVQLTPTWWAEKLGMTYDAVKSRVDRLKKQSSRSEALSGGSPSVLPEWKKNDLREAKRLLRNPEVAASILESLKAEELTDLRNVIANVEFERHHTAAAERLGVNLGPDRAPARDEVVATPDPVKSDPSDEVLDRYNRGCSELTQALSQMRQHGISVYALETSAATIDELVDRGHRTREAILDIQTELLKHEDKKARK